MATYKSSGKLDLESPAVEFIEHLTRKKNHVSFFFAAGKMINSSNFHFMSLDHRSKPLINWYVSLQWTWGSKSSRRIRRQEQWPLAYMGTSRKATKRPKQHSPSLLWTTWQLAAWRTPLSSRRLAKTSKIKRSLNLCSRTSV